MYWSPAQMVAHMTVNGATLRDGDLFGSGTISGPEKGTRGPLPRATWSGTEPVTLDDGAQRTFLEDGDTITLRATAPGPDGCCLSVGGTASRTVRVRRTEGRGRAASAPGVGAARPRCRPPCRAGACRLASQSNQAGSSRLSPVANKRHDGHQAEQRGPHRDGLALQGGDHAEGPGSADPADDRAEQ